MTLQWPSPPPPHVAHTRDREVNALEMSGELFTSDQILNAIQEVGAGNRGATIRIPEGDWQIYKNINPGRSGINFKGAGRGTRLMLADGANCNIFSLNTAAYGFMIIEDMDLYGNRANNASGIGISMDGSVINEIKNVNCVSFATSGIYLKDTYDVYMERVLSTDSLSHGIHLKDGFGTTLNHCVAQNLVAGSAGACFYLDSPNYTTMVTPWTEGNVGHGIHAVNVDYLAIVGGYLLDGNTYGLYLDGTTHNVDCLGLTTSSSATGGLYTHANAYSLAFVGSAFDGTNSINSASTDFIRCRDAAGQLLSMHSGIATILNGNATVTVDHACFKAPNVVVQSTHAETDTAKITSVSATQFVITVDAPVTANRNLYYIARVT